jgi:trigger factor
VKDLDIEDVNTVEEYKVHIRKELESQKEKQNENHVRESVITQATENAEFDIPQPMIEDETNRMVKQQESQIKQYGLDFKTYLQYMGKTEEAFREELKEQAKKNIGQQLVLSEIGDTENIEVTEEEINAKYDELQEQYKSQNVTMEQIKQAIPESAVKSEIVFKKTIDLLVESANTEEKDSE